MRASRRRHGQALRDFVFVTLTYRLVPRLHRSPWASPLLDGVNVAALALMAVVTVSLARARLDGWAPVVLFSVAAVALVAWRPTRWEREHHSPGPSPLRPRRRSRARG